MSDVSIRVERVDHFLLLNLWHSNLNVANIVQGQGPSQYTFAESIPHRAISAAVCIHAVHQPAMHCCCYRCF